MEKPVYRVSQINAYVKRVLAQDITLADLRLCGEVSNYKRHSSGHLYFSIKDEKASISAVMFASDAASLRFLPRDGQKVVARGSVSLYEKTGQYQFYVRRMEPDGLGALYQAYEALKERLASEGLFAPERKRAIPVYPRAVAIVTSPVGAAVQDMIHIARRRHPGIRLIVVPVLVQGAQAAPSIVRGLERAARSGADTILLGRGGGSMEDLWAFNEEPVARAIAASPIPVISAVGHETDFTIADFVADLRAPTPSAAAELAVPEAREILDHVNALYRRQERSVMRRIGEERRFLEQLRCRAVYAQPERLLEASRQELDMRYERLRSKAFEELGKKREELERQQVRLSYLDPAHALKRGYAYITKESGELLNGVRGVEAAQRLCVFMKDGSMRVRVESIQEEDNEAEYDI